MSDRRPFAASVMASEIVLVLSGVIGIIYMPAAVAYLGDTRYGLWVLVLAVGAFTSMFDLGFLQAIRRFQARATVGGNAMEVGGVLTASLRIYGVLGVLAMLTCMSAMVWLPWVVEVPAHLLMELNVTVAAVGIGVVLQFISACFLGVAFGAGRLDLDRAATLVQRVVVAGVTLALLAWWRADLIAASVGVATAALVFVICSYGAARRACPGLRVSLAIRQRSYVEPMIGFAGCASILALGGILIEVAPKFVAGHFLDTTQVTALSIPVLLVGQLRQFIQGVSLPLFQVATQLDAAADEVRLRQLYVRASRLTLTLGLAGAVPMTVFGEVFISAWMGSRFAEVWTVLGVLLLGEVVRGSQFPGMHLLSATREISGLSYGQGLCTVLAVVLMVVSVQLTDWGLLGIASAVTVSVVLFKGLYVPMYTCRQLGQSVAGYFRQVVGWPAVVGVLSVGLCVLLRLASPWRGFGWAAAEIVLGALMSGILGYWIALDGADRAVVGRVLRRGGPSSGRSTVEPHERLGVV